MTTQQAQLNRRMAASSNEGQSFLWGYREEQILSSSEVMGWRNEDWNMTRRTEIGYWWDQQRLGKSDRDRGKECQDNKIVLFQ